MIIIYLLPVPSVQRLKTGKTAMTRSPIATDPGGRNASCRPSPKVSSPASALKKNRLINDVLLLRPFCVAVGKSFLNVHWQEISHSKSRAETNLLHETERRSASLQLRWENHVSCCLKFPIHSSFSHVSPAADLYGHFKATQSSEQL